MFGYSHFRTWEWSRDEPARTVVFPFLSSGMPFMALKHIASIFDYQITTYCLLIVPRLWMTLLSLINDIVTYKLAYKLFHNKNIASIASLLYASSYTTLVFCTRTFSNSAETTLFGLLLYLVILKQNNDSDSSKVPPGNINLKKDTNTKVPVLLSVVIVCGLFTRISFIAFLVVPLAYWLCQSINEKDLANSFLLVFMRAVSLLPGAFLTIVFFLFCDCCFFKYDLIAEFSIALLHQNLTSLSNAVKSLPVTPLNAVRYNFNISNLAKHGIHPRYVHVAINLPLMFTPVVLVLIPAFFNFATYLRTHDKIGNKKYVLLLLGTVLFSLAVLSFVHHQEPRFLLPLIVPLVVLLSRCLYPLSSCKLLLIVWFLCNFFCYVLFALFHQGGVIPSLTYVNSLTKSNSGELSKGGNVEVIYYHTYMPPVHLAAIPQHSTANQVHVSDLAGSSYQRLEVTLDSSLPHSAVYLVVPATLPCDQLKRLRNHYLLEQKYSVFPHLSIEDPPWSGQSCAHVGGGVTNFNYFVWVLSRMTLSVYKVKLLGAPNLAMDAPKVAIYSSNMHAS